MRQFGEEGGKSTDGGQKGRLEAKIEGGREANGKRKKVIVGLTA